MDAKTLNSIDVLKETFMRQPALGYSDFNREFML